jgi:cytochrome P450
MSVTETQPPLEQLFNPNSLEYAYASGHQCLALARRGRLVWYEPWQAWIMTQLPDILDCWKREYLSSDFYDWEFAPARPAEQDWGNFERALIGHSLVADHDHHRLVRRIVSPAFSRNVVDEIQRRIEPDVQQLFDCLLEPEVFDYKAAIAEKIPFISITRMVGIPEKYWPSIKPVIMNFTKTWNPTISDEQREQARQECNQAIEILKEIVAERRHSLQQDDFLSTLLRIEQENEKFDEWDILTLILALIGAGADTTLVAQQWTAYALLKNPDQVTTALATPESFANAFNEVTRWAGSSKMGFARYAPRDMEILGHAVRRGQMVLLMPHLYQSDPAQFPEPEKFDVSRRFDPDIVFGYGPRYCIGAALAKHQLYLSMSELFKRFPGAELAEEPLREFSDHNAITFKQLQIKTNCR